MSSKRNKGKKLYLNEEEKAVIDTEEDSNNTTEEDELPIQSPLKRTKWRRIIYSDSELSEEGYNNRNVQLDTTLCVGTFADDAESGEDDDDFWMSQIANDLNPSVEYEEGQQVDDNNSDSSLESEGNGSPDDGDDESSDQGEEESGHKNASMDEYDTSDEFINDKDSNEDENGVGAACQRLEEFKELDPYLLTLTPIKNTKCSSSLKRKINKKSQHISNKKKHHDVDCLVSDEEEHDVTNDTDVQEVSIHKINLSHKKFSQIFKASKPHPEKMIIKSIIKRQNEKNENDNASKYEERKVTKKYEMVDEDALFYDEEERFKVKIFAQVISKRPALMTAYGVKDVTSQLCHTLIFHYRKNEIFVLTTNQAWNVVQRFSDFSFPGKIAARILSRKGALEVTRKGLIGTDFVSKRTHKQMQESNPFDILTFCTSYTTAIEENASILKLKCFSGQRLDVEIDPTENVNRSVDEDEDIANKATLLQQKKRHVSRQTTKVTISQAAVRFLKRFRPTDFLAILNHLSIISRGKPTETVDGKEEMNSSAHIQYLQQVHVEVAKDLDLELSKRVHSAIADDRHIAQIKNFDFSHKHFLDFFYGYNFFLKYNRDTVKHWKHSPPTCAQVIKALRNVNGLMDVQLGTTDEQYKKVLDKCKIVYETKEGRNAKKKLKKEKVLNFIQGMLFRPSDNNVYWHIQGSWCYLQPSYILLIQNELLQILEENLKEHSTIGLKFSWPSHSHSHSPDESTEDSSETGDDSGPNPYHMTQLYLEQYKENPNFVVFPETQQNPYILDMLRVKTISGKNMFTVFYILPSLSHQSIHQGVNITNALTRLRKSGIAEPGGSRKGGVGVGGSEHNLEDLKKLYDQVKLKPRFYNVAPTFPVFQQLLSEAPVILGIGKDLDAPVSRTLAQEKAIPTTIEVETIHQQLLSAVANETTRLQIFTIAANRGVVISHSNCRNLAVQLHQLMIQNKLLASDNTITSKLVALSPISIPISELSDASEFLYTTIVSPFQPPATTFLAKLELIRIWRHVRKLGIRQFFIGEIPLEDCKLNKR